ncbi:DUF5684 domain-containing protein [Microbacterium luticocti]|uniref:DUF5684 domain-containing protein n=1 Tax=Microbacterium luticocti TaxID=451764 RepID=UPI00041F8214|nr:DUF5684 domain-containing protein [Microbacterium luticocti]
MNDSTIAAAATGSVLVSLLLTVVVYVWVALALQAVFRKTGEEGWKAWVPLYNIATLLQLGGFSGWLALLSLVPVANVVVYVLVVITCHKLNIGFGYGAGMTVLAALLFPVWASVVGFSSARWVGAAPTHRAGPVRGQAQPAAHAPGAPRALAWQAASGDADLAYAPQVAATPVPPMPPLPPRPAAPAEPVSSVPGVTGPRPGAAAAPVPGVPLHTVPGREPVLISPDEVGTDTDSAAVYPPAVAPRPAVPASGEATDATPRPAAGAAAAHPADAAADRPAAPPYAPAVFDSAPPRYTPDPYAPAPAAGTPADPYAPAPAAGALPDPYAPAPATGTPADPYAPAPAAGALPDPYAPAPATGTPADPYAPAPAAGAPADPYAPAPAAGDPWAPVPAEPSTLRPAEPYGFSDTSGEVSAVAGAPVLGAPMSARSSVSALRGEPELPEPPEADAVFDETVIAARKRPAWVLLPPLGAPIPVHQEVLVLGRRPSFDPAFPAAQLVPIADETRTMSKTHARLELDGGTWVITDLDSTNGVVLIDDDGTEIEVAPGRPMPIVERFLLGDAELSLVREGV